MINIFLMGKWICFFNCSITKPEIDEVAEATTEQSFLSNSLMQDFESKFAVLMILESERFILN